MAQGKRGARAEKAAQSLREQHPGDGLFRQLIDAMPHSVWILQPDGRCGYFNQRWLDYSGLSLKASLQGGWLQQVHCADERQAAAFLERVASGIGPATQEIECRLRRCDGTYRWMLCRAVPQHGVEGASCHWLGTFTDIDDLKQAASLLEQALSMNRIAGRVARLGGWTIDLPDKTLR